MLMIEEISSRQQYARWLINLEKSDIIHGIVDVADFLGSNPKRSILDWLRRRHRNCSCCYGVFSFQKVSDPFWKKTHRQFW